MPNLYNRKPIKQQSTSTPKDKHIPYTLHIAVEINNNYYSPYFIFAKQ